MMGNKMNNEVSLFSKKSFYPTGIGLVCSV